MCGRARCVVSINDIFEITGTIAYKHGVIYSGIENVSPGMEIPVVCNATNNDLDSPSGREIKLMHWGLVPSYLGKDEKIDFFKMFNARIETCNEKRSFKRLLEKNRCVVVLNGFYEWKLIVGKKVPHYISSKNPLIAACLFEEIQRNGNTFLSFTIITENSQGSISSIHDRQPLFLTMDQCRDWLNIQVSGETILRQLRQRASGPAIQDIKIEEVSPKVTNASYQGGDCSNSVKRNAISSFFSPKSSTPIEKKEKESMTSPQSESVERSDCGKFDSACGGIVKREHATSDEINFVSHKKLKKDSKDS